MQRTLKLTLKKKWYDLIKDGTKKEEYREIKQYWISRLCKKTSSKFINTTADIFDKHSGVTYDIKKFDHIEFKNGYAKNAPTMLVECLDISIGNAVPEWSDNWQGSVFVIKLGEKIK